MAKSVRLSSTNPSDIFQLNYLSLRNVVAPEDQSAGRRRYCGIAKANELFPLDWDENVRSYLGRDEEGKKRKPTLVNMAIRNTLEATPDLFPLLNSGLVIVARDLTVDDNARVASIKNASIINGAQTQGVLKDYFADADERTEYPSVNFELIVTDEEEIISSISIARNFQNRVADLSIYGRRGLFDELERAMQKHDKSIKLTRSETDYSADYLDTEKLVQVITAMLPQDMDVPSAKRQRTKTAETLYRVYAYRHRSRCLKDFAEVMEPDADAQYTETKRFFLDMAWPAWDLYQRFKSEQSFSSLRKVKGETEGGRKVVVRDGVPDGIVFPMLSAMSRFIKRNRSTWKLEVPPRFPWNTLFQQARTQFLTTADHNPQTMGKQSDCYVALHGAIEMYFAVTGNT